MKLLSCYIEGYGKIKRKEYTFTDGINAFYLENGEGKTTLASFIKAMFYGLKGYRKGSLEFCDRERFYPFDGGLFGGNITFSLGDKVYKIERFFGDKSESADTLRVFVNGEQTDELGEEIGKALFGLDKDSFERTLFLDSGEVEISSTSGIQAKLNNVVEGLDEEDGLDGALLLLEKAAKVYKKSRAGADKVTAETAKLAKLEEEIANAQTVKGALEEKYVRENGLREEIASLSARIVEGQGQNERLSQFEHYDSIFEGVEKAEKELASLREKYPLGVPTLEEMKKLNAYLVRGNELSVRLEGQALSSAEEEKFASLGARFALGTPDEKTLSEIEDKAQRLAEIEVEVKLAEGRGYSPREEELLQKFDRNRPTESQLNDAATRVEEYKRLRKAYEETPAALTDGANGKGYKKYALLGCLAAILLVVGGALAAVKSSLGIPLLAVGGVGLLLDGFLYLNAKSAPAAINPLREKLGREIKEIEEEIKGVLLPLGYRSDNGVAYDFSLLQADFSAYGRLLQEREERRAATAGKARIADALSQDLSTFFAGYALSGESFIKLAADLRLLRKEHAEYTEKAKTLAAERVKLLTEIEKNQAAIEGVCAKYRLQRTESTAEIVEDIRAAARLEKEIAEGRAKAADFKESKGLGVRVSLEKTDIAALQALLQDKQGELNKLNREIAEDERLAESLDGYETDKTLSEGLLKEYKRKHRLLQATSALLKTADERLKEKYVKPIKDEFSHYAKLLERTLDEKVEMTKNFQLLFERNGALRSEKHLSSGQRSICGLCFRLALIKNMYGGRTPFLVLDDPFTSLDEAHFGRAAALLRELAKDTQMIYFTCHESRKL